MIGDFDLLYGNDDKMMAVVHKAKTVYDPLCLGYWDASSNSPELLDGVGTDKTYYIVSVSGSQDLGSGEISYEKFDYIIYDSALSQWKLK